MAHDHHHAEGHGHHHHHGEMALSYALRYIEEQGLAELTNYGEFLEKHPPEYEVEIIDDTSWSCIHGVERWRSDCGCNSGGNPGWNQAWRGPLRQALDWLLTQENTYRGDWSQKNSRTWRPSPSGSRRSEITR